MDQEIDDYNDASWAKQQTDEQMMLYNDPGYAEFLINYAKEFTHGAQADHSISQ